jgi:hypothetical protein
MTAEDVIEFCADKHNGWGKPYACAFFARRKLKRAYGGALASGTSCRG